MKHTVNKHPVIKRNRPLPLSFLSDKKFGPPKTFPTRDETHMKYFPGIDDEEDMPFGEDDPYHGEC